MSIYSCTLYWNARAANAFGVVSLFYTTFEKTPKGSYKFVNHFYLSLFFSICSYVILTLSLSVSKQRINTWIIQNPANHFIRLNRLLWCRSKNKMCLQFENEIYSKHYQMLIDDTTLNFDNEDDAQRVWVQSSLAQHTSFMLAFWIQIKCKTFNRN